MLDNLFLNLLSFFLGDIIGPGILAVCLLIVVIICLIRGYKSLAYLIVLIACLLMVFLAGTQLEKQKCEAHIQEIQKQIQEAKNAEK